MPREFGCRDSALGYSGLNQDRRPGTWPAGRTVAQDETVRNCLLAEEWKKAAEQVEAQRLIGRLTTGAASREGNQGVGTSEQVGYLCRCIPGKGTALRLNAWFDNRVVVERGK